MLAVLVHTGYVARASWKEKIELWNGSRISHELERAHPRASDTRNDAVDQLIYEMLYTKIWFGQEKSLLSLERPIDVDGVHADAFSLVLFYITQVFVAFGVWDVNI